MGTRVVFSNIRNEILQQIENAQKEVIIAVAWFTDIRIIDSLLEKIQKDNIKVWILFYDDKINKKELYRDLYKAGATIRYTKTMMHNKFCVIDKNIVINGSYNWTQNAHSNNRENVQISNNDVNLANSFIREFNKLSKDAVNYYCYATKHETIKAKIESNLDAFYRDYKGLFQEPEEYPCIMEIPEVYTESNGCSYSGPIYFNKDPRHGIANYQFSKDMVSIPIYILLKNRNDFDKLIETLFASEKNYFMYSYGKQTDKVLQILLDLSKKRTLESFKLRNTNISLEYPVILKVCGLSGDKKSQEFVANDLNYRYIYPKKKFFIVRREKRKQFDTLFILELIKPNGEVLKQVNKVDFYQSYDYLNLVDIVGGAYMSNRALLFIITQVDGFMKLKIPEWRPVKLIDNHVIVSRHQWPWSLPSHTVYSSRYNIVDYSGNCILPYYDGCNGFICYKEKDQDTIEFLYGYSSSDYYEQRNEDLWDSLCKDSRLLHLVYNTKTKEITGLQAIIKAQKMEEVNDPLRKRDECYIATMAYHDINHPKVQVFRMFRDNTLVNYEAGRRFISFYYAYSPSWVKVLKGKKRINNVIRKLLDGMVYFICRLYKIDFDSVNKK